MKIAETLVWYARKWLPHTWHKPGSNMQQWQTERSRNSTLNCSTTMASSKCNINYSSLSVTIQNSWHKITSSEILLTSSSKWKLTVCIFLASFCLICNFLSSLSWTAVSPMFFRSLVALRSFSSVCLRSSDSFFSRSSAVMYMYVWTYPIWLSSDITTNSTMFQSCLSPQTTAC